jgi:hypothetical protein
VHHGANVIPNFNCHLLRGLSIDVSYRVPRHVAQRPRRLILRSAQIPEFDSFLVSP